MSEALVRPSIAFPLRLDQGLLRKTSEQEAFLSLVAIMARTTRGSWAGNHSFGFNDFFVEAANESLSPEKRKQLSASMTQHINDVLDNLGLTSHRVESIFLEPSGQETFEAGKPGDFRKVRALESRGFVISMRARDSARAFEVTI
jgi:hypothetical protein